MALRLISVTRRFGRALALDGVSLHVRPGDCYGFLGHNGAGKTTSMRVALGLERPDAGRVVVDGFDAAEFPREARARMGGLVETPGFHGHLGGAANLVLLARLQGLDGPEARREAVRLLDAVGLAGAGTKAVRNYSQGMRQRLGIAQALLGSPKVVLLDEPMNGLDPEGIEEVRRLLLRLTRDEGMTVLLSSHQLGEIAGLCNRIGILRRGRMLVEEETSKLLAAESGRYALATADDAAAAKVLAASGVAATPRADGGLEVSLGARAPEDVAADLVANGVRLRAWAPRPPSLEEIYLRFTKNGEAAARPAAAEIATAPPAERRAPSAPVLRVMAYEFRRWTSAWTVPALLAIPALFAAGAVWSRHGLAARDVQEVHSGTLATATTVTAFEAIGDGLSASVPVLVVLLAGLASQSLSGEASRGTLRNVLLRPVTRTDAALGKSAALLVAALVGFALAAGASLAAAAHWFEFKDVGEYLPNGEFFSDAGGRAELMWPALWRALATLVAVLPAFVGIGFLAGALPRSGAAGLGLALGAIVSLFAFSVPASVFHLEGFLPTAHAPWSKLCDDSVVHLYIDTTVERGNPHDPYAGLHVAVPLVWAIVSFAAAALVLRRRSVK
jgi:ABC-2 type transport system ATP-binding protein